MIRSKSDYDYYLAADRLALRRTGRRPRPLIDPVWKYQRLLRRCEYWGNCRKAIWWRPYFLWLRVRLKRLEIRLGFSIPLNRIGPGLAIVHRGTLIINDAARIGENFRVHAGVNIGAWGGPEDAPRIGNNVYVGPGAVLFGRIEIADGIAIGANAVVNRSFTEPGITLGGVPARKVGANGSRGVLVRATDLMARGVTEPPPREPDPEG